MSRHSERYGEMRLGPPAGGCDPSSSERRRHDEERQVRPPSAAFFESAPRPAAPDALRRLPGRLPVAEDGATLRRSEYDEDPTGRLRHGRPAGCHARDRADRSLSGRAGRLERRAHQHVRLECHRHVVANGVAHVAQHATPSLRAGRPRLAGSRRRKRSTEWRASRSSRSTRVPRRRTSRTAQVRLWFTSDGTSFQALDASAFATDDPAKHQVFVDGVTRAQAASLPWAA